jgi:hypothetical protein
MTDQVEDPFAETVDEDDPFATAEDVARASGPFVPRPYLSDLAGRLVVMVPREFTKDAPKRKDRIEAGGAETEERYTVDMACLDGGALTFWYNKREEANAEPVLTEHTIEADELPFLWTSVYRTEGNVIGQLKKIDGKARPLLIGRVRRGAQAPDRKKGVTTDQVEAAWTAWDARGRKGPQPKFSWIMDVDAVTPEDKALALAWLKAARADGFSIN